MADDTADAAARPNRRKVREGIVVSDSMDATVVVAVVERVRHPATARRCSGPSASTSTTRLHRQGGRPVRVVETRPLSKLKRWRLPKSPERAR